MRKGFLIAALIVLAFTQSAYAATYYVDKESRGGACNDSNPGTLSQPWCTIGKANTALQKGDSVYIRGGTYRETIRPANSGTQGNYISYVRYNDEEVIITGVSYGADLRDRHYIKIDGLKILNTYKSWINMIDPVQSSTHNIIQNCHFEESRSWAGIWLKGQCHYNRIRNNTIIGYAGPDDLIYLRHGPSHNVIEGNDLRYGPHNSIDIQSDSFNNVVRNNRVWNPWHSTVAAWTSSDQTLFEGNIILDAGADNANIPTPTPDCAPGDRTCDGDRQNTREAHRRYHSGIQLGSSACIIRNNLLVNNGRFQVETYPPSYALRNRIYNNTSYRNYDGVHSECGNPVYGNIFKNNIFFKDVEYEISKFISLNDGENENYYFSNNINGIIRINYLGGTRELSYFQSNYPNFFQGNVETDPLFVDSANVSATDNSGLDPKWLHLRSSSPMIDAGAFLTKTTSSGSGTVIWIEDASYFYDGWGIPGEQGDLIQLEGQTQTARITSIDYDNNRITVDRSLTWSTGQGVSLPYKGSAPDIGAYEYGAAILYGDVSENGSLSAYDASLTAQHAVGIMTLTPEQQTKADVSGEGTVSAFDASWIARKVVDPEVVFPVEE